MTQEEKEIYKRAFDQWGLEDQVFMVFEECSELINALCKLRRGRVDLGDLVSELADVQIMLEQMIYIYSLDNAFEEMKKTKLERLKERLEKYK